MEIGNGFMIYKNLNSAKALIWRITHRDNLSWILGQGLHAASSTLKSRDWKVIGNNEIIERRSQRVVPITPGGVLNDYVPFYFTPFSPMLYNIYTGRGGVTQKSNQDIVILVSSVFTVKQLGLPFVFTDKHAYAATANYYNDTTFLNQIDWPLLQKRNFQKDLNDPGKIERYQAEALIYQHVPLKALLGVICYSEELKIQLQSQIASLGLQLKVYCRPNWYF